jgi:hypothetical protein
MHFTFRLYFVQNKYAPHTNNSRPSEGQQRRPPPRGAPHSLKISVSRMNIAVQGGTTVLKLRSDEFQNCLEFVP